MTDRNESPTHTPGEVLPLDNRTPEYWAGQMKWADYCIENNQFCSPTHLKEALLALAALSTRSVAQSPERELEDAYEIGALAMCHYYHREYAGDEWKKDHAKRAVTRQEHLDWAKQVFRPSAQAKGGE